MIDHDPVAVLSVIDRLLPRLCVLCRQRTAGDLCPGCDRDLPRLRHGCARCGICAPGLPDETPHRPVCGECIKHPPTFDHTVAALEYAFPVPVLVQGFKYNRNLAFGAVLSQLLLEAVHRHHTELEHIRALVPVPLHPIRLYRRVFNQAELLACDLGRALAIPVRPNLLVRTRMTPAQSGLPARKRRKNLRGAFACRQRPPRYVALVDDVMTTGATVSECARELKRAGAEVVSVWVAARA